MSSSIFRLPEVKRVSGLSRSTVYKRIAQGYLTKPVLLGGRAVGWPANEIHALNNARIAGWSEEDIKQLVKELELNRKFRFKRAQNVV